MPYRQTIQELEAATLTNAREGLSEKEAAARLQRFGGNELESGAMNVKRMATSESETVTFENAVEYFRGK